MHAGVVGAAKRAAAELLLPRGIQHVAGAPFSPADPVVELLRWRRVDREARGAAEVGSRRGGGGEERLRGIRRPSPCALRRCTRCSFTASDSSPVRCECDCFALLEKVGCEGDENDYSREAKGNFPCSFTLCCWTQLKTTIFYSKKQGRAQTNANPLGTIFFI